MATTRFPIRVGRRSRIPLRIIFGVRADNAWVDIGDGPDGSLDVQFGRFPFHTSMANVTRWQIEGPWRWITAIGVRLSIRHHEVSFDGSHHGGVRIDFRAPVRYVIVNVPAIYASVDDLEGLGAELARLGIPGKDARTRRT